ncbi:O-antigen polymerase [Microbacterium sp. TWP3-1-2b2]|uniref:O-antigen polymerase n=1 Tax=Microbacterium sp. TWP3-1-2b2 TaxID=2804651 RepID=UPI003CECF021
MEFALLLCFVTIGGLLLTRASRMPLINAVSVATVPWLGSVLVAVWFGGVTDGILDLTWIMLLASWLATIVGALIGWAWRGGPQVEENVRPNIDIANLRSKHMILIGVLAAYVATQFLTMWPTIQSVGGLGAIFDGAGDVYRRAVIDDALSKAQSGLGEGGLLAAGLNYVLFIVGMSSLFTGSVLWVARYRLAAIVPVALSSAISILTLQRTSVVLSVLLFTFGVFAVKWSGVDLERRAKGARRRSALPGIFAGLVALGAAAWFMVFLSGTRGGKAEERGIVTTFAEYLLGGLAGLNARNAQGADWAPLPAEGGGLDPTLGMGGYTFGGLWSVLARLGFPVEQTRYNLNFTPVNLFGEATITNVAGALGEYYLDFRWAGIIVISAALAFLTATFQRRLLRDGSMVVIPALAFLLTVGAWSFFGSWFSDLRLILLAVLGGLILKWAISGTKKGHHERAASLDSGHQRPTLGRPA